MKLQWADAGLAHPATVRDCWRSVDLKEAADGVELEVPPRFVEVLRLYPEKK
jgi:hypothetical protein